jgi:predicted translin family RNA/ssDNA-binding protein
MLRTIKGIDSKPYISLEDFLLEISDSIVELDEDATTDSTYEEIEYIEYKIHFLEKLHDTLIISQTEYYKKILGM